MLSAKSIQEQPDRYMNEALESAMGVLRGAIRAGRKVKAQTNMSLKEKVWLIHFRIPYNPKAFQFWMATPDQIKVIKGMLKAPQVMLVMDDEPFELAEHYPWFGGRVEDADTAIVATLWSDTPWWAPARL